MNDLELLRSVQEFLYREGEYLDGQRWDDWLALFDPEVEYWVPAWDSEHELTGDPMSEMSLIYYRNRSGLEDRIFRLRTGRSSASTPLPRTTHLVSNIRITGFDGSQCQVKASWVVFSFKDKQSHQFNGRYEYVLAARDGDWVIKRKKTIVINEVIPSLMDIYSI
ncbi:aromatic-ring-hydroxylating dioxygenase subunit beta [Aerosticca soli]|uniref:Benzoate 1,2-dioxygenase beta subunit n=1 Tax=Aerosticca soli TaxID=2010829 RepID=A0A2Z6E5F5_9GAMM|nr:aromatic-ring-hydroxylating dioxygenase subunit beta [Aerosticca soli]BBD79758.1 benzoate 1,2-dioxygenase beta subunit [Aerosticca soli]